MSLSLYIVWGGGVMFLMVLGFNWLNGLTHISVIYIPWLNSYAQTDCAKKLISEWTRLWINRYYRRYFPLCSITSSVIYKKIIGLPSTLQSVNCVHYTQSSLSCNKQNNSQVLSTPLAWQNLGMTYGAFGTFSPHFETFVPAPLHVVRS